MKTAKDLMTAPVRSIGADQTVREAAAVMLRESVSCLPVLDDRHRVVGMLSHTDFTPHARHLPFSSSVQPSIMGHLTSYGELEEAYQQMATRKVREVMAHPAITIQEDAPLSEVVETMLRNSVKRLPILREELLVGIVSRHDLLKLIV